MKGHVLLILAILVVCCCVNAASATETFIKINSMGNRYVGESITVSGTTNLPADTELAVEIIPYSGPTRTGEPIRPCSTSGTVLVESDDYENSWRFSFDTGDWVPNEYTVRVDSEHLAVSDTMTFNLLRPYAAPGYPAPSAASTAVPTPVATTTPGFGALVAFIGICMVGILAMMPE